MCSASEAFACVADLSELAAGTQMRGTQGDERIGGVRLAFQDLPVARTVELQTTNKQLSVISVGMRCMREKPFSPMVQQAICRGISCLKGVIALMLRLARVVWELSTGRKTLN